MRRRLCGHRGKSDMSQWRVSRGLEPPESALGSRQSRGGAESRAEARKLRSPLFSV